MSSVASVSPPPQLERQGSSASSLSRSRTWSQTVQKNWVSPVLPAETIEQRAHRYGEYFNLTTSQMGGILGEMTSSMDVSLRECQTKGGKTELRMLDTCLDKLPGGDEKGVVYCLDFAGQTVRAVRAKLEGGGRVSVMEHQANMADQKVEGCPNGLMDERCGALELFDFLAGAVEELLKKTGDKKSDDKKDEIKVAFTVHFPMQQHSLTSASISEWSRGFKTGRATNDPVENVDLMTLLDMAFWRNKINAKCCAVINGTAASLIACEYEKPRKLPACAASFVSGEGVNGVYVESNAAKYGYTGTLLSTEVGGFDRDLPITDVDLEVDYAEGNNCSGTQLFEKMAGGLYLGEVCRRLAVKVYQNQAPALAWARKSMPTSAAALIVADQSEGLEAVGRILNGLWEWETSMEQREMIKKIFAIVFSRSAALSAIAIAAISKQSGRLQPAMGGLTVAVDATVHAFHTWYSNSVRQYLKDILQEQAAFIHLYVIHDGSTKGGSIAASTVAA